jgi:hypothetical protein
MYLGTRILTIGGRDHRTKVPVPEHTHVNMESFSNDNNLDKLLFDRCDKGAYFDRAKKYVYSEISLVEHDNRFKK